MLKPVRSVTLSATFSTIVIGFMANNILPARLGEIVRAYVMHREHSVNATVSLVSVLVERIFDGLGLLAILCVTTLISPIVFEYEKTVTSVISLASIVFITTVIIIIAVRIWPAHLEATVRTVFGQLPFIGRRVVQVSRSCVNAISFLKIDKSTFLFLLLTVAVWGIEGAMYWMGLLAFGMNSDPKLAYFTLALVNFGLLIPSAPAYLGVFQGCAVIAFGAFGIDKGTALSYSIVLHLLQFVPVTILGLCLLSRSGIILTLSDVWRKKGITTNTLEE